MWFWYRKRVRDSSKSSKCSRVEVGRYASIEWGPFSYGEDLSACHVQPVEARRLYDPSIGSVTDDHDHPPLISFLRRHDLQQAHHIVYQPVATIGLVGDLGICQNYWVKAANLYHPNGLRETGPQPSHMLKFPRDSPRGRAGWWHGHGSAVWRRYLPWLIGWMRQMGILVGYLKSMSRISLHSFYGRYGSVVFRWYLPYQSLVGPLEPVVYVITNQWVGGLDTPVCPSQQINL